MGTGEMLAEGVYELLHKPNKFWRPDIQHVTKIDNNVLDAGNPVCSYHSTPK